MKKIFSLGALALAGVLTFTGCSCNKDNTPTVPTARLETSSKGDTCASNDYTKECTSVRLVTNMNEYMGRSDSEYIDLRDYNDYMAGNGGHIEGFKMVQFFADIYGTGTQLFVQSADENNFAPRYSYSVELLETYFPKDKNLFLMCAAGGRVVTMMQILDFYGWDMSKVYNIGGMNNFTGENADKINDYTVVKGTTNAWKFGLDTEGTYKTTVALKVDNDGKITEVYVAGNAYTTGTPEGWNQANWLSHRNEYTAKLVGKTKAQIETMLGSNGASGADVVTGATLSSNRVLRAVLNALNA